MNTRLAAIPAPPARRADHTRGSGSGQSRAEASPPAPAPPGPVPPAPIYISTAIAGDIARQLGATHYSYHFAAALFTGLLTRHGLPPRHLPMPEMYADAAALGGERGVHLIFRSTEQIRLLKPAVNIGCFPWEFPVLKTDTLPEEHPFANQTRMLNLCDEIWTPSEYGRTVLEAHGVANVYCIPAPVAAGRRIARAAAARMLADVPCCALQANFSWQRAHAVAQAAATVTSLGAALRESGSGARLPSVYLSILNPEDFRKNLDALVRGFHAFRAREPGAVLIVKALTAVSRHGLAEVMGDVVAKKLAPGTVMQDRGILFVNAYLSDEEMSALYSLADAYVSASLGEGQNLPLLEAMAHGTLAITPRHTAMEDYIDAGDAFIVRTRAVPNDSAHLAGTVAGRAFEIPLCGAADIAAALDAAHGASQAERAARRRAGMARVAAQFGEARVWKLVAARLARHGA